jgi:hypothetical protein
MHHLQKSNPDEYEKTIQFICDNTPEISDASVRLRMAPKGPELDFFFTEATSNAEREVFWTGDGLQIWLQVLYHSFRQCDVGTLVLDEPDVFLHPDLQRRLVAMLEDLDPQIRGDRDQPMVAPAGRSCQVRRGVHDVTAGHHRDRNSPGLTGPNEIDHGHTSATSTTH